MLISQYAWRSGARIVGAWLVMWLAASAWAQRVEIDLSGTWQFQKSENLDYPPGNAWQTTTVPGYLQGWDYERAWFRTNFTLPSLPDGTRYKLRFGGVKFASQTWLNGTFVGEYLNGYEPFEFDITDNVLPGQQNELIVGLADWTGVFSYSVDFSNLAPYEAARDHAKNALLAPIGGRYDLYGIWQPVKIACVPPVSIQEVFAMPSVRSNRLSVRVTLRNDSAMDQITTITTRVLDGAATAVTWPNRVVSIPAETTTNLNFLVDWKTPILWSHLNPHLYTFDCQTSGESGSDAVKIRFGFRELWREGSQFVLNGTPINLLATATWPPDYLASAAQVRKVFQDVKAGHAVAMRLHTQPWDEKWYDIADEEGMLLIEEGAVWCDAYSYRLGDPEFWTNYSQHLIEAVRRDRNHPSIVLWSLENELLSVGGARANSNTVAQLAALGRQVRAADPTRLITFESDLDPGGVADVIGLHYPHEFPDFQVWPNTAYWLDQAISRDWVAGGKWKWDRSKPLYIGEFLWVPGTSPGVFSILLGDDAYLDPAKSRNLAKAATWRMQIEAYRASGVGGMAPWTMFEDPAFISGTFDLNPATNVLYQAQKAAYEPNAVFLDQYTPRYFAGETAQRTGMLYNDQAASASLVARWSAGSLGGQSPLVTLSPAGRKSVAMAIKAPAQPGPFALQLKVQAGNKTLYSNSVPSAAYARTQLFLPASANAALFDPRGTSAALFKRFNLTLATISNLNTAAYDSFDLLVIGRHALTNNSVAQAGATIGAKWEEFMSRGGRILILEQTNYPTWLPGSPRLDAFDASYAFPNAYHPITKDLPAESLRWWAGDHRVVAQTILAPASGNFRTLAAVGSPAGLDHAAALEIPFGSGGMLCAQWLVNERFDVEPMAGILLQRMLDYCTQPGSHPPLRPAALLSETNSAAGAKLFELGLHAENVAGKLGQIDPAVYPVLMVAGGNTTWQEAKANLNALKTYANSGGTLLLHRPPADFFSAIQLSLFPSLEGVTANLGQVLRKDVTNAAVHALNDDLHWVEQAGGWDRPEILSTNLAERYYRKRFNLASYSTIQVAKMPVHTSGAASGSGWMLNANGFVAQDITVSGSGSYLFNVSAKGTPALGGWPQVILKIDGVPQDYATVASTQLASYTLAADLTAGTHQLALAFENDAYAPPEDRNLFLQTIQYGRELGNDGVSLLAKPGVLAQAAVGAGRVILDEVKWEEAGTQATKAGRYASRLLTELGVDLSLPQALRISAATMTNVNIAAYQVTDGITYVYSNGRVQTSVQFPAAGTFTIQFRASGTPLQRVYPQVSLLIDGQTIKTLSISSNVFQVYTITATVKAGTHTIALAFINDASSATEDRNVAFDYLSILPQPELRLAEFQIDSAGAGVLIWEATPGTAYQVQYTESLNPPLWQSAATVTSKSTVASWRDDGKVTGSLPGAGVGERYYRIKKATP